MAPGCFWLLLFSLWLISFMVTHILKLAFLLRLWHNVFTHSSVHALFPVWDYYEKKKLVWTVGRGLCVDTFLLSWVNTYKWNFWVMWCLFIHFVCVCVHAKHVLYHGASCTVWCLCMILYLCKKLLNYRDVSFTVPPAI